MNDTNLVLLKSIRFKAKVLINKVNFHINLVVVSDSTVIPSDSTVIKFLKFNSLNGKLTFIRAGTAGSGTVRIPVYLETIKITIQT